MRPRSCIEREERLVALLDLLGYPTVYLFVYPLCGVALVFELVCAAGYFIFAVLFTDMVERIHIVDIVATVEIIEALIGRQILAVIAEMPLAEATGCVARSLESLRYGYLVAEHTVGIAAHLDGVKYTGRGEGREGVNSRIYDIVGISAIGIAPGERGKTRRRADGIARIEIRELRALFADAVDVRGIIYRAVCGDIAVAEIVHENKQDIGRILFCFIFVYPLEVVVLTVPKALGVGLRAQVHGQHERNGREHEQHTENTREYFLKSNFFIDFHNAENNADYNGYTRQGEQEIAEQAGEEITLACKPGMLRARKSRKTGSERAEARIRAENYVISDNAEQRGAVADKKAEIKSTLEKHTDNYKRGHNAAKSHTDDRCHIEPRYPHREHECGTDNADDYREHFLSGIKFYLFLQIMTS